MLPGPLEQRAVVVDDEDQLVRRQRTTGCRLRPAHDRGPAVLRVRADHHGNCRHWLPPRSSQHDQAFGLNRVEPRPTSPQAYDASQHERGCARLRGSAARECRRSTCAGGSLRGCGASRRSGPHGCAHPPSPCGS
ncbi:hypothetical protein ACFPRL_24275 [Pseudoclavibacter helvolus]